MLRSSYFAAPLSSIVSTGRAFPILHELEVVLALVEAGEVGHLSAYRLESLTDLRVGELPLTAAGS